MKSEPVVVSSPVRRSLAAALIASAAHALPAQGQGEGGGVDLSGAEISGSLQGAGAQGEEPGQGEQLARRWYENVEVWGFGAATFVDSGDAGSHPKGSFLIKQASLFLEADVWEDTSLFFELQAFPIGVQDAELDVGELHGHLRNPFGLEDEQLLSFKAGRFDLPFGEEYLIQDATDNPLITNPVAFVYGVDEGVQAYGRYESLRWNFAVTDGMYDPRNVDLSHNKAFTGKVGVDVDSLLSASVSGMHTGKSSLTSACLSGMLLRPVGSGFASSVGSSPSTEIEATLWEVDADFHLGEQAHVACYFGQAHISDEAPGFDRNLTWFAVRPHVDLTDELYVTARLSELGTYSDTKGYTAEGRFIADGGNSFGYDTKRLQRISVATGYRLNPRALLKVEAGRDRFWVIDASSAAPGSDDRFYFGAELVVEF